MGGRCASVKFVKGTQPLMRGDYVHFNSAGGREVATRLQADLDAFLGELGLAPIPLPHAKPGIMSNRIDPAQVFRRDQIDRINRVLAEEFEFGGYPIR